jgi:hypothetical protein
MQPARVRRETEGSGLATSIPVERKLDCLWKERRSDLDDLLHAATLA